LDAVKNDQHRRLLADADDRVTEQTNALQAKMAECETLQQNLAEQSAELRAAQRQQSTTVELKKELAEMTELFRQNALSPSPSEDATMTAATAAVAVASSTKTEMKLIAELESKLERGM
jgi:hypothetical protein